VSEMPRARNDLGANAAAAETVVALAGPGNE